MTKWYSRSFTIFHGATLVHQRSATIAVAQKQKIIWSMLPSSSLPTLPLLRSSHPLQLITEETGPSGV